MVSFARGLGSIGGGGPPRGLRGSGGLREGRCFLSFFFVVYFFIFSFHVLSSFALCPPSLQRGVGVFERLIVFCIVLFWFGLV